MLYTIFKFYIFSINIIHASASWANLSIAANDRERVRVIVVRELLAIHVRDRASLSSFLTSFSRLIFVGDDTNKRRSSLDSVHVSIFHFADVQGNFDKWKFCSLGGALRLIFFADWNHGILELKEKAVRAGEIKFPCI